ncbi:hypothetical protein, partial [Plasmodium yoelii yoelii]
MASCPLFLKLKIILKKMINIYLQNVSSKCIFK